MVRLAAMLLIAACGASQGPRVAVLPETWASTRPEAAPPAAPRITQALRAHRVTPIAEEPTRQALAAENVECDDPCLRRVGERLGANKIITLKLAELGATVAVQLTVFDVRRAAREATLREVVNPSEASRIAATLDEMGARVARQTAPEQKSRRWLWLGAGGVVVGAAVLATVLILRNGDDNPDSTIVPP
jgi:hypothetical protein